MIRAEIAYKTPFMKKPRYCVINEDTMKEAKAYVSACGFGDDLISVEYFDLADRIADIKNGDF